MKTIFCCFLYVITGLIVVGFRLNDYLVYHNLKSYHRRYALPPSISCVKGIGKTYIERFHESGIFSIVDLVTFLPKSIIYRAFHEGMLEKSEISSRVTVVANVSKVNIGRFIEVNCYLKTNQKLKILFYGNINSWKGRSLLSSAMKCQNQEIVVSGKLGQRENVFEICNPDIFEDFSLTSIEKIERPEPCYPRIHGILPGKIRGFIRQALMSPEVRQIFNNSSIEKSISTCSSWPSLMQALEEAHFPSKDKFLRQNAIERLAFEELVTLFAARNINQSISNLTRIGENIKLVESIMSSLPYNLTQGQRAAISDIFAELSSSVRMVKLLQGDVGSGKSIIAYLSMFKAIDNGMQSLLLAPSEVLVSQHYENIKKLLSQYNDSNLVVSMISSDCMKGERENILRNLKKGKINILVGTHSLFAKEVISSFQHLGLAVIDEEHKFGVAQREIVSNMTNVLYISATPQPRSLFSVGILNSISQLKEKPPNRCDIDTRIIEIEKLQEVIGIVGDKIKNDEKIFWVCPCKSPSLVYPKSSAEERLCLLQQAFDTRVGLIHGKLSQSLKSELLNTFRDPTSNLNILVCTTVVEIGVDIPIASVCVIDRAECFGLAQLHQIRGRVGRSSDQKAPPVCLLIAGNSKSKKLDVVKGSQDGFTIAEMDSSFRGKGDIFGEKQHGKSSYRIASLKLHENLLPYARNISKKLLEQSDFDLQKLPFYSLLNSETRNR